MVVVVDVVYAVVVSDRCSCCFALVRFVVLVTRVTLVLRVAIRVLRVSVILLALC